MEATQQTSGFTIYLEGIEAHQGNVLAHAFLQKAAKLVSVLSSLERAYLDVAQRQTDFEIIGAGKINPTTLTLKPVPKVKNYNPSDAFRWSMAQLDHVSKGEQPDPRVQGDIARDLVELATKQTRDGYKAFWVNGYSDAIKFDDQFLANAARFARQRAIEEAPGGWREGVANGSIIGELKKVDDVEGEQKFVVVPKVGPEQIACTFPDFLRDTMGDYLFKVVRVTGKVHYGMDSPFPILVEMSNITKFPVNPPRRTFREMRGVFGNYDKPERNWDDLLNA